MAGDNSIHSVIGHFLKKCLSLLVLSLAISAFGNTLAAQQQSISLRANALVIESSELDMITIQELLIDDSKAVDGKIRIAAQIDPDAGKMMIKGRPGDQVRISLQRELLLFNSLGNGTLLLSYEIYGFSEDNSLSSEPFNASERIVQLNMRGEYFLWIGGNVDISLAQPGSYNGEFTLEIEYTD